MYKIYIFFIFLFTNFMGLAQIPNASFEFWTANQPNGWRSHSNPPTTPYTCETTTNNAYVGATALRSDVVYPGTTTLTLESGVVTGSASSNYYIPIATKPNKLFGWYILNCWNDTFSVNIWLISAGVVIGSGKFQTKTAVSSYSQFTVNITYSSTATPDSCKIDVSFNQPDLSIVAANSYGEYFIIDNLYFDINVGVEGIPFREKPLGVFPNPTAELLNISSHPYLDENSEIEILNTLGQSVLKIPYKSQMDVYQLATGCYIIKITTTEKQQFYSKFIKE